MLPTIQIGNVPVTRLLVGTNPFLGKSHLTDEVSAEMHQYFTEEKIYETLRSCEANGINAVQAGGTMPLMGWLDSYRAQGGTLRYLATTGKKAESFDEDVDEIMKHAPSAIAVHGELADKLYLAGRMDLLKELLDRLKTRGLPTGLGAHFPEVLAYAEEHGWEPDYYMASVYNLSQPDRSHDRNPEGERFEDDDVPKMYAVIRNLTKPTIALKILGAGRRCGSQEEVKAAFEEAYAAIKPNDCVLVGMFPKHEDQVRLNAEYAAAAMARVR